MFKPDEIVEKAKKRERHNLRFRTWLKVHADAEELDAMFKALHEKLFADYDCTQWELLSNVQNNSPTV